MARILKANRMNSVSILPPTYLYLIVSVVAITHRLLFVWKTDAMKGRANEALQCQSLTL